MLWKNVKTRGVDSLINRGPWATLLNCAAISNWDPSTTKEQYYLWLLNACTVQPCFSWFLLWLTCVRALTFPYTEINFIDEIGLLLIISPYNRNVLTYNEQWHPRIKYCHPSKASICDRKCGEFFFFYRIC